MPTRKLNDVLTDDKSGLAKLTQTAQQMVELVDILRLALPEDLRSALLGASFNSDQSLTVTASSSAMGARLRYHTDTLLSAARTNGILAARCRIRVSPQANTGDG